MDLQIWIHGMQARQCRASSCAEQTPIQQQQVRPGVLHLRPEVGGSGDLTHHLQTQDVRDQEP
jgi:hypothetical protein